ncbi:beta strand repeat-containing protein, partial [Campylobacter upsaliensis]
NQQGIQSRLIPSFLALSVISALYSPLSANWVINQSDSSQTTNSIEATITNDITLNNKNTAIWTQSSGSGQLGSLTINEGVTIQVNKANGKGVEINTGRNGTAVNNITNNGHINTKGTGISINDRSSAETITVGANGSITSANGNAIYVGNGSRVNHIDIQGATTGSGGIINRGTIGVNGTSQPNGIKVTGSITSNNNRATALTNHGTIHGGINIENGGTLTGGRQGVNNALYVAIHNNGGTINGGIKVGEGSILNGGIMNYASYYGGFSHLNGNIEVAGTINGTNIGIQNSFGTISGDVKITDKGKVTGNIWNQGTIEGKIEIKGKVDGLIANRPTGVIKKDIEVSGGTITNNISNWGMIEAGIKVENGANITGDIYNEKTIQNGIDIANSQIGGNIVNSGTNANTGNISITGTSNVGGSIVNQNGANFTNNITLEQNSKLGGISNAANSTMSGTLTLNGEVGTIYNAGQFDSTLTLSNKVGEINNAEGGTISNDITINNGGSVGAINNAGTMQAITNNGTGTLTLTNSGGTIDKITNGTGATATIRNQGKITNGIINDGGTLTVFNDFRKDESAANGYHTIGEIGKTTNGVHIENKNNGKLHLDAWYFNKEDYATAEERKNNALLVEGNYAGITLGDVFVNTQGLDVDKTYNANTLIADKDGNMVGDKINNGQGIDVNKLHSVSGIYTFENYGGKGEYRAIINRDELSGKSLAQSIIYSQRVRNVNLSRILREATTQVFVSGKEGEANGKSLSQLEQLHTNHRDENSQNHTFV